MREKDDPRKLGPQIKFGRLYALDERDGQYLLRPNYKVASERMKKHWPVGPILNQGNTPQCVGYSGWKWLWMNPVRNRNIPSAYEVYKGAQRHDEWPGEDYDGSSIRGLMKYFQGEGWVSEYQWAFDIETIIAYILTIGPIVIGSPWYQGMMEPNSKEFIYPTGIVVGGHAYLFSGVNKNKKVSRDERGAFRLLNSWGEEWGKKGRAWLSFESMKALLRAGQTEACAAVEIKKI